MKPIFIILTYLLLSAPLSFAQGKATALRIGAKCPDLEFSDMSYWHNKTLNTRQLKGKWFVLDFWNKYCTACVASFPETNELQKKYGNRIQFFLVGFTGTYWSITDNRAIRQLYRNLRQRMNLQLPIAYDSVNFKKLRIGGCPYIILVDDKGIIQAVTNVLNDTLLAAFFSGQRPITKRVLNKDEDNRQNTMFNPEKPFLVNGNGGNDSDFLFRSLLSAWDPTITKSFLTNINVLSDHGFFQVMGNSLYNLYSYAYLGSSEINIYDSLYGKTWFRPVLENIDSSEWQFDYISGRHLYCYSIQAPLARANQQYFMKSMQDDLERYFGYKVRIERREMPCWQLILADTSKKSQLTLDQPFYYNDQEHPQLGFTAKKYPVDELLKSIDHYHSREPPFINVTGLRTINITLKALMTDLTDINKGLIENGLKLVKAFTPMTVLVVYRDMDPSTGRNDNR